MPSLELLESSNFVYYYGSDLSLQKGEMAICMEEVHHVTARDRHMPFEAGTFALRRRAAGKPQAAGPLCPTGISSLGNIIVMTYTAARVKQEIAKEGILPWVRFFGQNSDLSLGRLLRWVQTKPSLSMFHKLLQKRWLSPEQHAEKTPVGALILHFASCVVLIFATYGLTPENAYNLLTGLAAYVLNAFFGSLLAAGILILRFTPKHDWRNKSKPTNHALSIVAATIYLIGNLFPIITTWVPESGTYKNVVSGKIGQVASKPAVSWFVLRPRFISPSLGLGRELSFGRCGTLDAASLHLE